MADDWGPLFRTTTRPPRIPRTTRSTTPDDVDDQAPIPLIVGIALALFIGFIIIVCCMCRRRSLSGSSSSSANHDPNYQRAPTGDGAAAAGSFNTGAGGFNTGAGGFNTGAGANSYPMAPVTSAFTGGPGQPSAVGVHGQTGPGAGNLGAPQPAAPQHPYPSLPPNAYSPPYPLGNAPLPAYMPTSHSSHTSTASGPSSDQGPSGFSSSSPPAPAPAPTGMMAAGAIGQPGPPMTVPALPPRPLEMGFDSGMETTGVPMSSAMMTPVYSYAPQGQGYGVQGQGMGHPGFQGLMMGQRGVGGVVQGYGGESGVGQGGLSPTMHTTAMDYVPGGGFVPRMGSPVPAGTTMTELDHL